MKKSSVLVLLCLYVNMAEVYGADIMSSAVAAVSPSDVGATVPSFVPGKQGMPRDFPPPNMNGCDRQKFQDARSCCQLPQVFSDASIANCANQESRFFAMLNKMGNMKNRRSRRQSNKNRMVSGSRRGPGQGSHEQGGNERSGHGDKFMCILKAEEVITDDGSLDLDVLKSLFETKASVAWQTEFNTAVTDCQALQASSPVTIPDIPPFKISTMLMLKCIRQRMFMKCPTESISTTDTTCPAKLAALSDCNPFEWVPRMGDKMGPGPMGGPPGPMGGPPRPGSGGGGGERSQLAGNRKFKNRMGEVKKQ